MDYDEFMANDMVMDACIFNVSQLDELANKIDEEDLPELLRNLEAL